MVVAPRFLKNLPTPVTLYISAQKQYHFKWVSSDFRTYRTAAIWVEYRCIDINDKVETMKLRRASKRLPSASASTSNLKCLFGSKKLWSTVTVMKTRNCLKKR